MNLVLASANKHKVEEIKALLPNGFTLVTMKEAGIDEDIPEPGATIAENSQLKAEYVYQKLKHVYSNLAVIADDSGLEVEVLNGAPGVHSARYAGEAKNDAANNLKLLEALKPHSNRKARFVTIITLLGENALEQFEGEVKGTIAFAPRGTTGFGYDPLFIPTGYRSTFAELGADIKNSISHRSAAMKKLVQYLNELNNGAPSKC